MAAATVAQPQKLPTGATFLVAGMSGISAWLFIHPFDVVKVRMQLMGSAGAGSGAVSAAREVVKSQGIRGLYAGLSAAITRQAVYTTARLGLYDIIKAKLVTPGAPASIVDRAVTGLAAGGIASFISCPVEADGRLPPAQRRGYTNIFNALRRIAAEEGVLTYWRGASPTVTRAMVVSMTQLGTYDQIKSMLLPHTGDTAQTHVISALTAAVVYSLASLPGQLAAVAGEKLKYTGLVQTLGTIARTEGVRSLWKGFTPYFARSGGHTVLMFIFKEYYDRLAAQHYAGKA
eukprot:5455-Heterococcus_DN1.PRE.1